MKNASSLLVKVLKDFKSDFACDIIDSDVWVHVFGWGSENEADLPLPDLVYLTLVCLLGYKCFGRGEKIKWSIPVLYKNTPYMLSHRKFGFSVLARVSRSQFEIAQAREMLGKLKKGILISERLIERLVAEQVWAGNVTLPNRYYIFRDKYSFFRENASKAYSSKPAPKKILGRDKNGKPAAWGSDPLKPEREGFYYATAMLDSYFSYLEHILVLLLAFSEYDSQKENLSEFIGEFWREKYKRIFNTTKNQQAKKLYDELGELKEKLRNAEAHGGFEKHGVSLFFHVPFLGAVPVSLSRYKKSPYYSIHPIDNATFTEACALFDRVDLFLKESSEVALPMKYIAAGLNVAFDRKSMDKYREVMKSEAMLDEYIEYAALMSDVNANMDW